MTDLASDVVNNIVAWATLLVPVASGTFLGIKVSWFLGLAVAVLGILALVAWAAWGLQRELQERELAAEQALNERLEAYPGKWVAIHDYQVVASADTYEELLEQIDEAQVEAVFEVAEEQHAVFLVSDPDAA